MKFFVLLAISFFVGCSGSKESTPPNNEGATETNPPAHSSRNSLDWAGAYRGEIPCADCEGILTTVYLNNDMSFIRKALYLGKSDSTFEESGKFTWNAQGNTVVLTPKGRHNQHNTLSVKTY